MGDLSFSVIDHRIALGPYSDLPWTQMVSSQATYFPRSASL